MTQSPTISLCMIVKNEETFLQQCLESVHPLIDEIIIVDTGSTDQTIKISKNFQARIFHYDWDDHFANARNTGLQQATGDWILWLDADEQIDYHKIEELRQTLQQTDAAVLSLPIINYISDTLEDSHNQAYLYHQPRLFRNHQHIQFIHRIHETLDIPNPVTVEYLDIPIYHFGYITEVNKQKKKADRNKRLLMKDYNKPNHSPWIEYHLASEFYREQDYQKAFEFINQSLLQFLLALKKPPALLYKLKYDILLRTNSLDQALIGIEKAIQLYPDYVDLHFYKGCLLFEQGDYSEALDCFNRCLELGDHHPHYLILKGVGSDKALEYKKACLNKLKIEDK
ncbi:glycosyltransferase family 2 protein [Gracilibacillus alcaliphilus]|uniref:glycosyltransferase family 2 protein n=1 Tax=Gracilibacillus alcaliphilus TaxID=1401441 RepID=UPI001EF8EA61|nr:glycosyltransferase family 2 protein [Gracilibacillus alcaliphilus]MBM7676262.1 glycosyltransferase involved in cell wall biosynthesis [Gracilibacillus alcaliphilus]